MRPGMKGNFNLLPAVLGSFFNARVAARDQVRKRDLLAFTLRGRSLSRAHQAFLSTLRQAS